MAHDIGRLEEKIKRLEGKMGEFMVLPTGFGPIIHRPGWTSIAEFALFEAGIDNLHRQIETAFEHCQQLLEAADVVGRKAAA